MDQQREPARRLCICAGLQVERELPSGLRLDLEVDLLQPVYSKALQRYVVLICRFLLVVRRNSSEIHRPLLLWALK
jgi:hypothetical protein